MGKWILPGLAATISLTAWIVFAAGMALDWDRPVMLGIALVGAFGLEATMWTTAAALSITVFQARKRIWRWMIRQAG